MRRAGAPPARAASAIDIGTQERIAGRPPSEAGTGRLALPAGALVLALIAVHVLAVREGPGWTSPLLAGDWLFNALLALATLAYALALGRRVARPLLDPSDDPLTATLVSLGLGAGCLSLGILFAGFLRLYYAPLFVAAGVALTAWLRDDLRAIWRQAIAGMEWWIRAGMPTAPTRAQRLVLIVLAITFLSVLLRTTLPVAEWDAVIYHLAGPKLYLAAHRIIPLPDLPLANAPSGAEMLFIPALVAGSDGMGKILNVLFALLLGLATYNLGRRHFQRSTAWLGVLLLFSPVWLQLVMPLTLTDFAATFLTVLAVTDVCTWVEKGVMAPDPEGSSQESWPLQWPPDLKGTQRVPGQGTFRLKLAWSRQGARESRRGVDRSRMAMARRPRSVTAATTLSAVGGARDRLLLRAGLLAGCSASFKLTSLPVIPALLLTIALCCLFTADAHDPRNTGADEHHAAATRLRSPFAAMGDPAAGVHACPGGCPSDAEGRSPSTAGSRQSLTPAWSVASRRAWPALRAGVLFGVAALLPLAPWLLKNLYFFGHIFYALAVQVSNPSQGTAIAATSPPPAEHLRWIVITFGDMLWNHMGALSAVLLLAPFLLRRPGQRAAQVFFLAGSLLWLLFVPFFEPPRYYMGLIAVGQALTAGVVGDIMRRLRRPQLADLAVAAYLLVACVPGLVAGLSFLGNPLLQRVALGAVSRREYLITHLPAYQAEEYADARLPRGAVVALVNVPSGYYMDRQHVNDWYGSTLAALQAGAASRRAVFAGWCKAGVGYAVFDRGSGSLDDNSRADVRPRGAFPWLATPGLDPRLIYTARGVDVLAIHPCLGRRLP